MARYLKKLDNLIVFICRHLLGIAMVLITVSVFVQVLIRYVFKKSMGAGIGEFPVYVMICAVWLGGVLLSRASDHITIDLKEMFIRNKSVRKVVDNVLALIVVLATIVFTYLTFKYLLFSMQFGEVTPGLQMPIWYLVLIMLICWILIAIYFLTNLIRDVKKWKSSS